MSKAIDREAYSRCSIKIVLFILNEGKGVLEGLINCAVAGLLLSGIAMKRTLYVVEDEADHVVFNLVTGKVVSCKSSKQIDFSRYEEDRKAYKESLKSWLLI